jgi:hypothetical protein
MDNVQNCDSYGTITLEHCLPQTNGNIGYTKPITAAITDVRYLQIL